MTIIGMGLGAILGVVLGLLSWVALGATAAWAVVIYLCVTLAVSVIVIALHWLTPRTTTIHSRSPHPFEAHSLRSG
ncbi:MAG: hypothetical protein ACPG7W_00310 [Paracoccaceae bacterium]